MNMIEQIENEQIEKLSADKTIPKFSTGDTLRIHVKVLEGARERLQVFEGVCIARKNAGLNSSFTVRKISYGEGVERVFPLYSPRIEKIEIARHGHVRRAKLYYLRGLTGKRARIAEKITHGSGAAAEKEAVAADLEPTETKEVATAADLEEAEAEAAVLDAVQAKGETTEEATETGAEAETQENEKAEEKAEEKTEEEESGETTAEDTAVEAEDKKA